MSEDVRDCVHYDKLLNIIHFNIRSLRKNFDELLAYLTLINLENVDVIVLSETWRLEQVGHFIISGFSLYYNNSYYNQNDGLVIYVKTNLNATTDVICLTETNLLRVIIEINNSKIAITGSYRSPSTCIKQYITDLGGFFESLNTEVLEVFVGDININTLGDNLSLDSVNYQTILAQYGFFPYINKPTRVTENTESLIDHIFVKKSEKNIFIKQMELQSFVFQIDLTDHYSVGLLIKCKKNPNSKQNKTAPLYKNEIVYCKLLNALKKENWLDVFQCNEVQTAYDTFVNKLLYYTDKYTKQIQLKNSKDQNNKPWITTSILNSIKHRDNLKRKFLKNKSLENKVAYTRYRNLLNKIIKKTKNQYYTVKLKNANRNSKKIWKAINEATNTDDKTKINIDFDIVDDDGNVFKDKAGKANAFNDHFINVGSKMKHKITQPNTFTKNSSLNDIFIAETLFLNPVTENEIILHINTLKNNSASGPDGISVRFVKVCHRYIVGPLIHIINLCFEKGHIPKAWKESVVTPVYKSGTKSSITNYRPISVINNFAKVFEKCLKQRLTKFLDKHNILTNTQFGFRQNMSTSNAVSELIKKVVYNINDDRKCLVVFLDLAKAFDTVDHGLLMRRLEIIGIRGCAFDVFADYLRNRQQVVKINGFRSKPQTINTGVPQGTVLGPVLFLIYINSLHKAIHTSGEIVSYADDTALIFHGNTWQETYNSAEAGLTEVHNWLNHSLLSLNVKKTKFMTFSLTVGDRPGRGTLRICGSACPGGLPCSCSIIERVNHIRYLGIIVDCHMRWNYHIDYLTSRLRSLIYKFYQVRDVLDGRGLRLIYTALAESIIRYCVVIWGGLYNNTVKNLEVMQNTLLKILFKKDVRHPTKLLYDELNLLNVRKLYVFEVLMWMFDVKSSLPHLPDINYLIRSRLDRPVQVPFFRKSHMQRFVFYYGPKLYNSLPGNIKNITSKSLYSKHIRRFIKENNDDIENLFKQ